MHDALTTFLRTATRKPFQLGTWDCGLWLADWYMARTGNPDPAAHLRGQGRDDVFLISAIARAAGLERTKSARRGDIGLISITAGHLVGSICTGTHWVTLCDRHGINACPAKDVRVVAAWGMP